MIWRLRLAWAYREWPWRIPKACRYIDTTRPPEHVFAYFRHLLGRDET